MVPMYLESKRLTLSRRATMFCAIRDFFIERNVLEVDTPILSSTAPISPFIEVCTVDTYGLGMGYLHTSPEHALKMLLQQGSGDIYQLGHVFRAGESGKNHKIEFTMLEWYRLGFTLKQMMQETVALASLFINCTETIYLSFEDAFYKYVGLDYEQASLQELQDIHLSLEDIASPLEKTDIIDRLFDLLVVPNIPKNAFVILYDFPEYSSGLAKVISTKSGKKVAQRFELLIQGLEIANGYDELTSPEEHLKRFHEGNAIRKSQNKPPLPIDFAFIESLKKGLPPCCGVAVGFDRLMMLKENVTNIDDVLPITMLYNNQA